MAASLKFFATVFCPENQRLPSLRHPQCVHVKVLEIFQVTVNTHALIEGMDRNYLFMTESI